MPDAIARRSFEPRSEAAQPPATTRDAAGRFDRVPDELLAMAAGGADPGYDPADRALGRAGPDQRWTWLGNYYTPEALAHDKAVRGYLAGGSSHVMAHVRALPLLPAAVGSYVRARVRPGPDDTRLP